MHRTAARPDLAAQPLVGRLAVPQPTQRQLPHRLVLAGTALVIVVGAGLALALRVPAGPSPASPTGPSPDSRAYNPGSVYGSAIGMDALNNTVVGGPDATSTSFRFRATTSSALVSIRLYVMGADHPGYGAGTGGTIEATVQPDDGTATHAPSGTLLATTTFTPTTTFPIVAWAAPATLVAGELYHVVFRNIDADPAANFASVNGIFMYQPTSPRQPAFSDTDWGEPTRNGEGEWADLPGTVPIMQLDYANGVTAGEGYLEAWVRSAKEISGPGRAREAFTVSGGDRQVRSFSVRLMRISGTSPLVLELQSADGSVSDRGTIAAADIPIGVPGDHGGPGHATWQTWSMSAPLTLAAGRSYAVVLSTAADTGYSVFAIRKGVEYGFGSATTFADGHAQYSEDGVTWTPFEQDGGGALDEGDLQFYFR